MEPQDRSTGDPGPEPPDRSVGAELATGAFILGVAALGLLVLGGL